MDESFAIFVDISQVLFVLDCYFNVFIFQLSIIIGITNVDSFCCNLVLSSRNDLDKQGGFVSVVLEFSFEEFCDFQPRSKSILFKGGEQSNLAVGIEFLFDLVGKVVDIVTVFGGDLSRWTFVVLDPQL